MNEYSELNSVMRFFRKIGNENGLKKNINYNVNYALEKTMMLCSIQ